MSIEKAKLFLDNWVIENVHDAVHPRSNAGAMRLALCCLEAAKEQGFSREELEEACGEDLVACMLDAQIATADVTTGNLTENDD
jgi:hypothetical protein